MAFFKLILWFRFLSASLYQLYLFQLKEYRFDRLKEHFSRNNFFTFTVLAPISLKKLPRLTAKAAFFFFCQLFFVLATGWLFALVVFPFAFLFAAIFLGIVDYFVVKILVALAVRVLTSWRKKGLRVIGVTGSFGKTSTTAFLKVILPHSLTPPLGSNVEKAIAWWILKNSVKKKEKRGDFLIVELGAYKKGEIARMCSWLKPEMAVITGIGNQHLVLFGSKKNLIEAKKEILTYAKVAFFNSQNSGARKMAQSFSGKKIFYGQEIRATTELSFKNNCWQGQQVFSIKEDNRLWSGKVGFLGKHLLTNLAAALSVATFLGIKRVNFKKLTLPVRRLSIRRGTKGALVLDGSFNQSEESILAGLELLKSLKFKEKVVFIGELIELGKEKSRVEKKIEEELKGMRRVDREELEIILATADRSTVIFISGRK